MCEAMASAQPGVHALKLQPPSVSHTLRNGSNFIKWDEVRTRIFLKRKHIILFNYFKNEIKGGEKKTRLN